jgi:hypothetical protein
MTRSKMASKIKEANKLRVSFDQEKQAFGCCQIIPGSESQELLLGLTWIEYW